MCLTFVGCTWNVLFELKCFWKRICFFDSSESTLASKWLGFLCFFDFFGKKHEKAWKSMKSKLGVLLMLESAKAVKGKRHTNETFWKCGLVSHTCQTKMARPNLRPPIYCNHPIDQMPRVGVRICNAIDMCSNLSTFFPNPHVPTTPRYLAIVFSRRTNPPPIDPIVFPLVIWLTSHRLVSRRF